MCSALLRSVSVRFLKNYSSASRRFGTSAGRTMRFVQFQAKSGGPRHLGVQLCADGDVFDVSAVDSSVPCSMASFLAGGDEMHEKAKRTAIHLLCRPLPSKMCSALLRSVSVRFLKNYSSASRRFGTSAGRTMRFVQFQAKSGGPRHLGVQLCADGDVFDVSAVDSSVPCSMASFLAGGDEMHEKAKRTAIHLLCRPLPSKMCSALLRSVSVRFLKNYSSASRRFGTSAGRTMRFVQFQAKSGGPRHLGVQLCADGDVFDVSAVDSSVPCSMASFLAGGDEMHEKAKRIVAAGKSVVPLSDVNLLAPITKPDKVACVGLNYKGHCDEQNKPYPKEPMIFSKFSSCIVGPYDEVHLPTVSDKVDWEVELAVVIGKRVKGVCPDEARECIFGYTVAQDITARDWTKERNNGQYLLGKSMDTFCPIGPAIVTKESLNGADNLGIRSWVNGVLKQDGNTSELVFKIDFLVSYLSQIMTLYPGDLILTGTPAGVGVHRRPPEFLKSGDVLESEIDGIGKMKNVIV